MDDQLYFSDCGNGTYRNPVLLCDYSDPDAIRVGDTYYMTASSFNYVPGLPILVSEDLVNWRLVNYALKRLPSPDYDAPRHACGVWAPSIRWHDGYFYIFFGMPDEGIFMVRAADPLTVWDEPVLVLAGRGLIDPCPFWDDDGSAWVIHAYAKSRAGFNSRLGIFPISPDGARAIGEDRLLYDGTGAHPTIEGPKVYKRDGWYYVFAPAGGVPVGWQTVLRSRNLTGAYEDRIVLRQGSTPINGPHQGAWVETPHGESWFLHFQSRGLYGRVTHLQPMAWGSDGWPVIGTPVPGETWGEPVSVWRKPSLSRSAPVALQASDDFHDRLGLQWQFMGNRQDGFLTMLGGALRLHAMCQQGSGAHIWHCAHVLTQKLVCAAFDAAVTLDASALQSGEQAGFGLLGGQYAYAAIRRDSAGWRLVYVCSSGMEHQETVLEEQSVQTPQVTLRMTLLPTGMDQAVATMSCEADGRLRALGQPFSPERHTWVGARLALFCTSLDGACHGGHADFGPFLVTPRAPHDGGA
ncbi:MAG: family 43 glycosylhydrolase [bacterium]|nr:family 43 glycosylhydrolase [bacterium]